MGELSQLDAGREPLADYFAQTWTRAHAAHSAPKTRTLYAYLWDAQVSRLGELPLRELKPEVIARWQADLLAEGVGPHVVHKAMKLLGNVLQRAAESGRIPANPTRVVRKAPLPMADEVRPLAPASVEVLRAAMFERTESRAWSQWDATLVSVMAYAGLRPQEARALRWRDIRDRTLIANANKTRSRRTVRLLAPLKADLAAWRLACGRPPDNAYVFPGDDGNGWTVDGYSQWRGRRWADALTAAGRHDAPTPYALRHSFASLLLHEGRSVDLRGPPVGTWPAVDHADLRTRHRRTRRRAANHGGRRHPQGTRCCAKVARPVGRRRARLGTPCKSQWAVPGSNRGPLACKASALTI